MIASISCILTLFYNNEKSHVFCECINKQAIQSHAGKRILERMSRLEEVNVNIAGEKCLKNLQENPFIDQSVSGSVLKNLLKYELHEYPAPCRI